MGGCASGPCSLLCCLGQYEEYKVYQGDSATSSPSCWPCAATGLYMPLPSKNNTEQHLQDAEYLMKSMKGLGTRESDLMRVIGSRSLVQLYKIKQAFETEYGNDDTLEQWIKDDTSGDLEKVLLMSIQNRAERDADLLNEAMAGLGTLDDELRELMATRSAKNVEETRAAYKEKYGRTLEHDIKDDTSFNYRNTFLALSKRAEYLAKQLHDAIKGAGTDDIRLIRILCSAPRSNALMRRFAGDYEDHLNVGWKDDLEYEISMPDLQDIKAAYQRLYHKSLVQDVANDTSGNYRRTLLTLLQPPEETTADAFNLALEGKGTDDELLIEVMTCRSNRQLQEAAEVYQRKYGRPLADAVKSDTSGDYEKLLLDLLRPRAECIAWHLHDAMAGLGTDDTRLMSLVVGKGKMERRRAALAYQKLYGKPLEDAIRSETSFWYRRYLIYLVRQSLEDWVWVPERQLRRLRDI